MRRVFAFYLFAATLAGCASSGPRVIVEPLVEVENRAPTDEIDVYPSPKDVGQAYEEVALLSVTSGERIYKPGEAEEKNKQALVEKAKELGADAVVITANYDPTLGVDQRERPQSGERAEQASEQERPGQVNLSRGAWTTKATAISFE